MYDSYLWGERGVPFIQDLASNEFLFGLGFDFEVMDEVLAVCYDLLENWSDPSVKPKDYEYAFHKLKDASPIAFVEWYTHLCFELRRYKISAQMGFCWIVPPGRWCIEVHGNGSSPLSNSG
jgi:hypothetical protein